MTLKKGARPNKTGRVMTAPNLVQKLPAIQAVEPKQVTCTFHQFFAVWANMQVTKGTGGPWDIPDFHIDILDFLSNFRNWENNTGLLQVFRGAAKSTIVGVFITWMLTQDPTLRFLILSCDKKTSVRVATDIAKIVAQHPLAKHLHGQENVWRADTLTVNGSTDGRNASVTSWGITSNLTGGRADWIIYDDVEAAKNAKTEMERENLRERLDEPTHIIVPGGYELFVGTPHSYDSIYTELEGTSGKEESFRTGCSQLKIPMATDLTGEFPKMVGTPTWPARFPNEEILKKQAGSKTKGHFLSQYLLLPYNPEETVLDPTLIATYSSEVDVHAANGSTIARINGTRAMSVACVWDPSTGTQTSDDSVLAIVFTTDDGHYYIHRAVKVRGTPEEQCAEVRRVMRECAVSHVVIENNGPGALLPYVFRTHAGNSGLTCEGKATSQNKGQKILDAYEVRLAGGYVHAHKSVMDSPFRTQLRDFSIRTSGKGKDDFIDAVAMALLAQPIRLKAAHYGERASMWQSAVSGGSIECEMDSVQF